MPKSVCSTHRRGRSPRIRKLLSPVRTTSKPGASAAAGRSTRRDGSASGTAARASFTRAAIAKASSRSPSLVAADVGQTVSPRAASACAARAARSLAAGTSILLSATIRGRPASEAPVTASYAASSSSMTSRSATGSRPGSSAAQSSTCTSAAHRSTCRRKSSPRPRPSLAPGIRPGTSAATNWVSPASMTPRCGISVVNG